MTQPVVVFPDAAAITIDYLRDALADHGTTATVTKDVPNPRPAGMLVTARRGGGPRASLVADNAQILVECWAERSEDAHDLAQLARALLLAMAGTVQTGVQVYRVAEFSGPAELPDPVSGVPRYVFTHQVSLRGTAA